MHHPLLSLGLVELGPRISRLTTVYVAHSMELDDRHGVRAHDAAFFKFGATKSDARMELEDRFNNGRLDDRIGMRTMPLALCRDWVVLGMWPGDEVVEGIVLDCLVPASRFVFEPLEEKAAAALAARTGGRAYGLNGLGDIRRIALADVGGLERRLGCQPSVPAPAAAMVWTAIAHLRVGASIR